MSQKYDVITYEHVLVFNYSLSDGDEQIERDVVLVWEDTLDKFLETHGEEKGYTVNSFDTEADKEKFITTLEDETEKIIDEVDEEISQKMKFSHVYTSPTYED